MLVALVIVPFALNGGLGTWVVVGVVWVGIAGVLVRRYRNRRSRDDPPPWVV